MGYQVLGACRTSSSPIAVFVFTRSTQSRCVSQVPPVDRITVGDIFASGSIVNQDVVGLLQQAVMALGLTIGFMPERSGKKESYAIMYAVRTRTDLVTGDSDSEMSASDDEGDVRLRVHAHDSDSISDSDSVSDSGDKDNDSTGDESVGAGAHDRPAIITAFTRSRSASAAARDTRLIAKPIVEQDRDVFAQPGAAAASQQAQPVLAKGSTVTSLTEYHQLLHERTQRWGTHVCWCPWYECCTLRTGTAHGQFIQTMSADKSRAPRIVPENRSLETVCSGARC